MATEIQTLVTQRNVPCISTVPDHKRRLQIRLGEEYHSQSSGLSYIGNVRFATCRSVGLKYGARWVCLACHMQGGQDDSGTRWADAGGRAYCLRQASSGEHYFVSSTNPLLLSVYKWLALCLQFEGSVRQNVSSMSALLHTHSFIQYSVWRQVQSLLQNDASI